LAIFSEIFLDMVRSHLKTRLIEVSEGSRGPLTRLLAALRAPDYASRSIGREPLRVSLHCGRRCALMRRKEALLPSFRNTRILDEFARQS
ncbi:MAG: hypothetical protein ACJA0W_003840, partial [Candidatus Azotimanducaceae bacterium]